MLFFSIPDLITRPSIKIDESLNIDIAHNIADFGVPNVAVSPIDFAPKPYMVATTGYLVTYPLAGFFKVFGFGAEQARVYMLIWMAIALLSVGNIVRSFFGTGVAIASIFLVTTFATFYDIGRTVMGELPGFVMMLWGWYAIIQKRFFGWGGFLLGLAVSTKPSLYLSLIPVGVWYFVLYRHEVIFKDLIRWVIGMTVPIFVWIVLFFPKPLQINTWREAYTFFKNPFDKPLIQNIQESMSLFSDTTFIYFFLIVGSVLVAYFRGRNYVNGEARKFTTVLLISCLFGFLYYLKSPGWVRYLFATELMLLILLPSSLLVISRIFSEKFRYIKLKYTDVFAVFSLLFIGIHVVQLFFFSSILASNRPHEVSSYVRSLLRPEDKVGIINMPYVAAFVPREVRYQQIFLTGMPLQGKNPLSLPSEELPRLILFLERDQRKFVEPYRTVLDTYYSRTPHYSSGVILYERN